MYPLVYSAKVFCLKPVHKYILGVWAKRRTSYISLAQIFIHSGITRFPSVLQFPVQLVFPYKFSLPFGSAEV